MAAGNTQANGSGSPLWLLVDLLGRLRIHNDWYPNLSSDVADNDSDKIITVASGYEWIIQSIYVKLTSTATAGNRQLTLEIQDDSSNVVAVYKVGVVQAASNTYHYMLSPNAAELTAVRSSSYISTLIPALHLTAGYKIRIYDSAAVDAAADDMHIQLLVQRRAIAA
jgi:hypothetical protein